MWDMTGLECLINVTKIEKEHEDWEKANVFRILQEDTTSTKPALAPLPQMIMRARYNSQRHYEIYAFVSDIPEADIEEMFESCPQTIVDAIRCTGHEIYSDRVLKKTQVIV